MKSLFFALLATTSLTFASDKMSVVEMTQWLDIYEYSGPLCREQAKSYTDESTCKELRALLKECNVVSLDDNGEQTDVANVVQCAE